MAGKLGNREKHLEVITVAISFHDVLMDAVDERVVLKRHSARVFDEFSVMPHVDRREAQTRHRRHCGLRQSLIEARRTRALAVGIAVTRSASFGDDTIPRAFEEARLCL